MNAFFAIFKARNIEYYRDKGSIAWAFMFPLLIIIGCTVAFSNPDNSVFKIGLYGDNSDFEQIELLQQPYIKAVPFDDFNTALERLQYHQLDLLLSTADGQQRYWINTESTTSHAAEQLFLADKSAFLKQQTSGRKVRYVDWVIPGVLGMNLMFGALFGVGYVIVRYRHNGVLKRLQATPTSALQFLSAQLASRLLIVVVVNGLIFIGCNIFLDLIVLGSYLNLLLITVMGGLAMISVGLLVSCRTANEELAGGLLNVATWPMLFLSEVWFSMDNSPDWLRLIADFMPLTHIVKATRLVMIEGASLLQVAHHLIWLAALTAICTVLAASLFRWTRSN
jgi:ABC-type multidrug transport system permease subunit